MQGQCNLIYMVMVLFVYLYMPYFLSSFGILNEQLDVHVANGSLIVDLRICRVSAS